VKNQWQSTLIGGYAVEYEGNASPKKAERLLAVSMKGLFERRYGACYEFDEDNEPVGYHMQNKKFHTKDLQVDSKFGTVLVALGFVTFRFPGVELPDAE
jgi:hypothetical protein